jgi:hypothetical protein
MTSAQLFAATLVVATALSPGAFAAVDGPATADKSRDRMVAFAEPSRPPLPDMGAGWHGPDEPRPARFDGPGFPPPPPMMGGAGRPRPGPEGHGPGRGPMGPPPAAMVATLLAAAETTIGIRVDQLDAWREFSSALVALVEPPAPPPPPSRKAAPEDGTADPFARVEWLAGEIAERGRRAEALQDAIETLRPVLDHQQTERLAAFEARLRPPHPFPPFAGGRHPEFSSPMMDPGPANPEADGASPVPPGE